MTRSTMLTTSEALTLFKSSKYHSQIAPYLYGAGSDACVFKTYMGALKITSCPLTHTWLKMPKSTFTPNRVEIEQFVKNDILYFAWEIERLEKLSATQSQYWERLKFEFNSLNCKKALNETQKLDWLQTHDTIRSKEWLALQSLLANTPTAKIDVFTAGNVLAKKDLIVLSDPVRLLKSI